MSDQTQNKDQDHHILFDPDQFYADTKKFLLENYNIRIEAQLNDPILIEIYVTGQLVKLLNDQMQDLHALSYQRNSELSKQWIEAEKQAIERLQERYKEVIERNSADLNQVFVSAMRKGIQETHDELAHSNEHLKSIIAALSKEQRRMSIFIGVCSGAIASCVLLAILGFGGVL